MWESWGNSILSPESRKQRGGEEGYRYRLLFLQPNIVLVYVLFLEAISQCLPLQSSLGFFTWMPSSETCIPCPPTSCIWAAEFLKLNARVNDSPFSCEMLLWFHPIILGHCGCFETWFSYPYIGGVQMAKWIYYWRPSFGLSADLINFQFSYLQHFSVNHW